MIWSLVVQSDPIPSSFCCCFSCYLRINAGTGPLIREIKEVAAFFFSLINNPFFSLLYLCC